ncbi:hypothetical protein H8E77_25570 [bacterium]|nr:hypothetical protein [bacterium]
MQSYRETVSYSNTDLETLFAGWFEQKDESKGAELLRIIEIELLLEIEDKMSYIRFICQYHPSVGPEDLRVDVERYAWELAFERKHRDAQEPFGDVDKRLRAYWNDKDKRKKYPNLSKQIQYVAESIVLEAITHNPRWNFSPPILPIPDEREMAILEILMDFDEAGPAKRDRENREIFSEDEKAYMRFILEWEGDSRPTDTLIEKTLAWGQSKAHRVKKSIAKKIISHLDQI